MIVSMIHRREKYLVTRLIFAIRTLWVELMFQPSTFFFFFLSGSSRLFHSPNGQHPWVSICTYLHTSSHHFKKKKENPRDFFLLLVSLTIAFFFSPKTSKVIMHSFRFFTQKPIISIFLPLLIIIHSVCSIPTTSSQPPHNNKEIPLALTTRGDDPSSDWTSQDQVWSTSLLQNSNIPAAKGIFIGVENPAPSAEYVDFVPGLPDVPTPEQELQQQQQQQQPPSQQQPGKLQRGENGCPTTFPSAVCDPGEGLTQITKAALPGFLNLDKCRQSMLSHLSL